MTDIAVTVLPARDPSGGGGDVWGVDPAMRAVEATGARAVALGDETRMIVVGGRVDQAELRRAIDEHPTSRSCSCRAPAWTRTSRR